MSRNPSEIEPNSGDILLLGGARYDVESASLQDLDGNPLDLRNQSAAVLAYLAARPGQTVTKDTLFESVWGDTFVTDDSLVQCISEIRRAIGDTDHRIIQTLPKQGYRLNAHPASAADPRPSPQRMLLRWAPAAMAAMVLLVAGWIWFGDTTGGAVSPTDKPRIAVLAFDDYSVGDDRGYLSDAIAEGIITELARNKKIAVIARNSSFRYRGAKTDIRQIGDDLGVHYVLEGSQQKSDDQLRVTAQLIDAESGEHLWAHTYDQDIGNLFAVQTAIIGTVADRIGLKIEKPAPGSDPDRVSALTYHLKALNIVHNDYSEAAIEDSIRLNSLAIAADPNSQYGYVGLAQAYRAAATFGWTDLSREEALKAGFENGLKALDIAPDDAEVHFALARLHDEVGETQAALARFARAIELNPSDSNILIASTGPLLMRGRTEEAIARLKQAMGIDPFHPEWLYWQMGWALWEKDQCDDALAAMQKMSRIPKGAHRMLAAIHACLGNVEEARAAYAVFYEDADEPTISEQRAAWKDEWTAPGSLDRWLDHMRIAGMRE